MRLPAAALIFAVAALAAGCGEKDEPESSAPDWEGEAIQLGSIFSETGIGSAVGPQQVKGVELAVEQVNEEGGVNGAEIAVEQIDDHSDAAKSVAAMKKLVDGEALAVLGPTFSNSAAEADPIANEAGTPVLAVSNTGPGIVGDCPHPCDLVFRDSLGEEAAIPANVETFAEENPDAKSAVVIFPLDDPFGESTAQIAADSLKENGIDVLSTEHFAPLEAGPQPAIETAIDMKADVLFVTTSSGDVAADSILIADRLGFEGAILGGNAFNSGVAASMAAKAGPGPRSAAAWYADNDSEANTSFIEAYEAGGSPPPDQFAAQSYTGLKLLAAAAESADLGFEDLDADRAALASSLAAVELDTPLGQFSFTPDHDVSQPIWIVELNGDGGYDLVTELPPE